MTAFDLDRAVSDLSPALERVRDRFWTAPVAEAVSYPDVHDDYAAIETRSYWFNHRNRCIAALVRRFSPGDPLLDVGGGNGIVSLALQEAGIPSIVLEPGGRGAEIAHARGLPVIQATLESARLVDGIVAAAGLFDVLEHIKDDAGTLATLARLIRPGGALYLSVPAYAWLWSDEDVEAGHARRYAVALLEERLSAAGFSISYATHMFGVLVPPVLLLRALPSRFGLGARAKRGVAADHALPAGPIGRAIAAALDLEARRIEAGRAVPFGTSILLAARRR